MKAKILAACLAALSLMAMAAFAQDGNEKIEAALLTQLTAEPDTTVPVFVFLQERASLAAVSRIPERAARGRAVVQSLQATAGATQAALRAYLQRERVPFTPYWVQNAVFIPQAGLELIQALAGRQEVAAISAEPVFAVPQVEAAAATTAAGVEWNVSKIGADAVWPTATGAGIVVASIDTGVRYTHQALVNQYRGKAGAKFDHNGNWQDPTGVCKRGLPCDNSGHGTHVTGTMVGSDGVSNQIGVAPGAKWIACKGCADSSSCYGSHLMACAQWVLDPLGNGSGLSQPDVVNNSWGGTRGDAWFMGFVDSWRAAGVFPAFAAGNTGPYCASVASPGDYPQAFAAGSTNSFDQIAIVSGRGPSSFAGFKPDVSAPGVQIRSSSASGDAAYIAYSGTSMASPHIAGAVALTWSSQAQLRGKVALTEQLLRNTAVAQSTSETCGNTAANQVPNNTYGHGRISAQFAALSSVTPNEPPVVKINSPSAGTTFNCPATISFSGSASDPEDSVLSGAGIAWFDEGMAFGLGGSVSKAYSCNEGGYHDITASVTDSGGLFDTDTIAVQIRVCKAKGAACVSNGECCSSNCSGKKSAKSCK